MRHCYEGGTRGADCSSCLARKNRDGKKPGGCRHGGEGWGKKKTHNFLVSV